MNIFQPIKEDNDNSLKTDDELEKELVKLLRTTMENKMVGLIAEDIKQIVDQLKPNIDEIISRKVKQHFSEIGLYIYKKFKE